MPHMVPSPQPMLTAAFTWMAAQGLTRPALRRAGVAADHLCFRTQNMGQWLDTSTEFSRHGELDLGINRDDRIVHIYQLNKPYTHEGFEFWEVKHSHKKRGSVLRNGWQVAQFALGLEPGETPQNRMYRFISCFPGACFNIAGMRSPSGQIRENPEVTLHVEDDIEIAFHPLRYSEIMRKELSRS